MRFLRNWLRIERPPGVALHPTRTVLMQVPTGEAFARAVDGIERLLGGVVRERNPLQGTLEATFGLLNSERITVTIKPNTPESSRVLIESRRGVSGEAPRASQYVDALAQFLSKDDSD